MKIGILTFHRAINYGAVLQCYALTQALKKMGHDVWLIDYRPWYFEKGRKSHLAAEYTGKNPVQNMKYAIASWLMYPSRKKTIKQFDNFLRDNFQLSYTFSECGELYPSDYDALVFGSDQIWSPSICKGFDKVYWGDIPHSDTRFITYAASIGGHNKLSLTEIKQMCKLLKNYDSISVREVSLQQLLLKSFNMDVPLVCDPTLLVEPAVFDNIAIKPIEKDYVLFFALEAEEGALEFAKSIASQLNCELLWLQTYKGIRKVSAVKTIGGVSVGEFLGYFKYARCVVSLSFHAAAFSVIFRKDFYSLACSQGDRARNLLRELELEERMVKSRENIIFSHVDYSFVAEPLSEICQTSRKYLEQALR